jgi:hypothetical protein
MRGRRPSFAAASNRGSSQFHEMADPALRSILACGGNSGGVSENNDKSQTRQSGA